MKVGILGGGQLARMIALAGYPLGVEFMVLDPSPDAGAVPLSTHLQGQYDDMTLLAKLADHCDVVTYEFENVPATVAQFLSDHTRVYPAPNALAVAQDRVHEKNFFHQLNIPTAEYAAVSNYDELEEAMSHLGYPAILKSRRMGYDGKGQVLLKSKEQLASAWQSMQDVPSIVEGFVSFSRELSVIAARSVSGDIAFYPLSENLHDKGILRVSKCLEGSELQIQAESVVQRLLDALEYVGIIALELFDLNGKLIANEFAPRVHNSGHWTIEGSETSQFENHLRAILGLPLGSTDVIGKAGMVNFIGNMPASESILKVPHAHIHSYDKEPRKGRKVGHATVRADDPDVYNNSMAALVKMANDSDDS